MGGREAVNISMGFLEEVGAYRIPLDFYSSNPMSIVACPQRSLLAPPTPHFTCKLISPLRHLFTTRPVRSSYDPLAVSGISGFLHVYVDANLKLEKDGTGNGADPNNLSRPMNESWISNVPVDWDLLITRINFEIIYDTQTAVLAMSAPYNRMTSKSCNQQYNQNGPHA